jgi:HD-GYP domain-containing protein (c-di-GMP phosphodiesterase class II)
MSDLLFNANSSKSDQRLDELEKPFFQAPNILIPIAPGKKNNVFGFFALETSELPECGQKNLNEITGTPFKTGLAGLTVYSAPFHPSQEENYTRALIMLANSIDRCDQSGHSHLTSLWAQRLSRRLGLLESEVQEICLAGKLHDIGKAVVSRELLTKPGPLTAGEWEIIRRHPAYSAVLMEPSKNLEKLRPMVRSHHEHYDGTGYPDCKKGQDIPLGGRILAVVDAYSTMISGRAYRDPISSDAALAELIRCIGTQFDPELVDHMAACLNK